MTTERAKALDLAIGQIEKEFGKGSIMRLGDASARMTVGHIPTGSLALDIALGIGGVPPGRVVEIFGAESSGKTTLAYHIAAQSQKMGGVAAYIDAENALDQAKAADHALKSGNNLGSLIGITIPVELDKAGMPVGLQLLSHIHNDDTLLAVALAVTAVIGTPVKRLGKPLLSGSL